MSEIVIRTVSKHFDPASKYYIRDWTAGDVVGIYPDGTLVDKSGNVKHPQQNKTSLIIRTAGKIPQDYIKGVALNSFITQGNKSFTSPILYRSERIVNLANKFTPTQLDKFYDKSIVNPVFNYPGSYLDLFSDRDTRTILDSRDKSGSANNATYIIGPDVGADYATFLLFEADLLATLTGPTIGNCDGSKGVTQETATITINGTTTTVTNYIEFKSTSQARHVGIWNAEKAYLLVSNGSGIAIYDNHVRLTGLQLGKSSSSAAEQAVIYVSVLAADNDIRIDGCIAKQAGNNSYSEPGITINDADAIIKIWNTICYGSGNIVLSPNSVIYDLSSLTGDIYNCTLQGGRYGLRQSVGTWTAKNVYAGGSVTADFSGTITKTTCASSDITGSDGLQNIAVNTTNFTNVTGGSEDFHLPLGSALIDVGTDTSGDPAPLNFTTDIDGQTRSAPWDIGADEYVAAGGLSILQLAQSLGGNANVMTA